MSDAIDFGDGSWEQAASAVHTTLTRLEKDINGNGTPGVKADVATLKTDVVELKAIARASLAWVKGIGWALGIAIAAGGLYVAYLQANHRISKSEPTEVTRTVNHTQDVGSSVQAHF